MSVRVDHSAWRETAAAVLLATICQVGGLGQGLHGLLGCNHAPPLIGSSRVFDADVGAIVAAPRVSAVVVLTVRSSDDCAICAALSRFKATTPTATEPPTRSASVERLCLDGVPDRDGTSPTLHHPRGPPFGPPSA